ncbi:zinc finger domain-containing protein [Streptomyces jumonjinensis]|uniref:DNA-binding phage zinc finger domain-containing protein n=1 Tax=Streptomyces jumonjinensis TaxID=1945 RepID=A0A646KLD9_STRJU|nr:hypothetical protein [Streptomyces jumonjinensis]MQT02890.1 hypothetical protein [Streptomyces jumonjinensis]
MDLDRPVAAHLAPRTPGRGPRRFRFIVFDHDPKKVTAAQTAADAAVLAECARAEGITPVPAASGSPGGIHLWTGCAEGVAASVAARINDAAAALCPSLDRAPLANLTDGLVRPPGAAHRAGGYSTLLIHTVDEAVRVLGPDSAPASAFERLAVRLEAMAAALPQDDPQPEPAPEGPAAAVVVEEPAPRGHRSRKVPPSIRARGPRVRAVVEDEAGCPRVDTPWRPLGRKAARSLSQRPAPGDDHSAAKHSPTRSMALAGWTQAQGLAVARDAAASPALEYIRTERQPNGPRRPRTTEQVEKLWARVWFLAVEDAARMPRRPEDDGRHQDHGDDAAEAVADLMTRMQAAGTARWARESGPADAAVLNSLSLLIMLSGTTDVSANVRRLAILSGYTAQTAAVALWRLIRDGWITVTAEAERRAGKARRVTLATAHECPDNDHHRCAIYDVPAVHPGSDRSGTPRPPAPPSSSSEFLRAVATHQQADVWHVLGHHAARTLWAIRRAGRCTVPEMMAATGYGRRATLRHAEMMTALQMVTPGPRRKGVPTYQVPRTRSLYEAAETAQKRDPRTGETYPAAGRMAQLAARYRLDQAVSEWWAAEEIHRSLPRAERPPRAHAHQAVIPGMDPRGRAYPRGDDGRPDHVTAREIEAERIGAVRLYAHAHRLARAGQLIDLPALTAAEPEAPPARRRGGRAIIPTRYGCPHCHAQAGARCVTRGTGRPAARVHARRREAAAEARAQELATARHAEG